MTKPFRRRPSKSPGSVLGQEPADLSPEALVQWREVSVNTNSFVRRITAKVGAVNADDIWSKSCWNLYRRLRDHGPVESVLPYFKTIYMHEISKHYDAVVKRAELCIGDDAELLSASDQHLPAPSTNRVEWQQHLPVLRRDLNDRQLKVYVLSEGFGLSSREIAKHLGGTISASTVRDDLAAARTLLETRYRARIDFDPLLE